MKLYQITESDLEALERALPLVYEIASTNSGERLAALNTQMRAIKQVLSNVRWNYGPHGQIENIE